MTTKSYVPEVLCTPPDEDLPLVFELFNKQFPGVMFSLVVTEDEGHTCLMIIEKSSDICRAAFRFDKLTQDEVYAYMMKQPGVHNSKMILDYPLQLLVVCRDFPDTPTRIYKTTTTTFSREQHNNFVTMVDTIAAKVLESAPSAKDALFADRIAFIVQVNVGDWITMNETDEGYHYAMMWTNTLIVMHAYNHAYLVNKPAGLLAQFSPEGFSLATYDVAKEKEVLDAFGAYNAGEAGFLTPTGEFKPTTKGSNSIN